MYDASDGSLTSVPPGTYTLIRIPNPAGYKEPWLVVTVAGKEIGMVGSLLKNRADDKEIILQDTPQTIRSA